MKSAENVVFCGWQDFCKYAFESGLGEGLEKDLLDISMNKLSDVGVSSYFISTSQKDYSLKSLAFSNTEYVFPDEGVDSKSYADRVIDALLDIDKVLSEKLSDSDWEILRNVDLPLSLSTAHMNKCGISVDREALKKKGDSLSKEIASIEKKVFELVGHEFNIASSQQLSDILFNRARASD